MAIYFPQFGNFPDYVINTLNNRRGNTLEVSKLNAWVRLTSGVGNGLILVSNPDDALFRATGTVSGIYDGSAGTATIGNDWDGNSVSAGSGGRLRPRPVVSSVEVDDGSGVGVSRKATISITAFSKEQMEKVCEYFLEPGYTVFIEFGWNTVQGVSQFVNPISVQTVSAMQNFDNVNAKRLNAGGAYENYLGYITGGSVSVNGDLWDINVELVGYTELPFYLQSQKTDLQITGTDSDEIVKAEEYSPSEISNETDYNKRLFKIMFNSLPPIRQTPSVKGLESRLSRSFNFINFDEDVRNTANQTTKINLVRGSETVTIDLAQITGSDGTGAQLVGPERFIRMEALMEILTKSSVSAFNIGSVPVETTINIKNTIIGAHKDIFSTDRSKLFIPNPRTPSFSIASALFSGEQGVGEPVDNSVIGIIKFPQDGSIDRSDGVKKDAYEWGYLRDLYINFDYAKNIIITPNFVLKDVVYNLLNGLSSAVNSQWQFEIQEAPDVNGNLNLQIIDLNFSANTENDGYNFILSGANSIFLDSSFEMDISGRMMNSIIAESLTTRIGGTSSSNRGAQPDGPRYGLFSNKTDKLLNSLKPDTERKSSTSNNTTNTDGDDKIGRLKNFLGKIAYYPRNVSSSDWKPTGLIKDDYFVAIYDDSLFLSSKKNKNKISGYSPLLPVKFSFTIHGVSGIIRGHKFRVNGIPNTFYKNGFFQVTSVKHTVDGMMWKTQVEGGFRNIL